MGCWNQKPPREGDQARNVMTERFAHGVAIGTKVRPRPSPERIVADKTHARRSKLVRTVKTAAAFQLELAFMNAGCGTERPRAAEKDCGQGELRSPVITRHRRQRRRRRNPIGTARYRPVRRVVWGPGANYSRLPDWPLPSRLPMEPLRGLVGHAMLPFRLWTTTASHLVTGLSAVRHCSLAHLDVNPANWSQQTHNSH